MMEYIDSCDLDYILNKYHDTQKPFNSMNRFIRHDEIFDPESGMEAEALYEAVKENDRLISGESHPMRKAKALAMLLEHTRIACDPRDRFPALNILDRPIARCIVNAWRGEVFGQIMPDVEKRRGQLEHDGVVAIWPDYDHSVPVWERVFTLGFPGLIREADEAENKLAKDHCLSQEEQDFYASIRVTYEAMITLCRRLRLLAEGTNGSERLAKALCTLETGAPRNTYEVLLIIYLYFMVSEHVDSLQVRSLCNMDVMLYPYYKKDLENGISEDELRKDLAYFLLQFTAIGNYWNQPFYLGGMDENGVSLVNPLSYVILDIYDRMGIYNPKIQIKTAESTPQELVCNALDMIRRGHSRIVDSIDSPQRRGGTIDFCDCYEGQLAGAMRSVELVGDGDLEIRDSLAALPDKAVSIIREIKERDGE
ncbi:MAG: pyruvate formate lyase family protein [Clostridia bacterium]|nr:pyruvate formate lyase family protein [Clostridia bacterium]